jgi:thioredoxin reductase/ferredoxin
VSLAFSHFGLAVYLVPLMATVIWLAKRQRNALQKTIATLNATKAGGLAEPVSLHPIMDVTRCLGCGTCAAACPEGGQVLGVVGGVAELIDPSHCIGHGACKEACPRGAITLVFGTEKRGVDIPHVGPNFETNVPGIFIAGELGGMGLIRNAAEQGRRALECIRKLDGIGKGNQLDLVIVGAGPAGFAASLGALDHRLRFITIEQDSLGGTVAHFPRGKVVMTAPVNLPIVGKVKFTETTKEALLKFWEGVEKDTGVQINYGERLETIDRLDNSFLVRTSKGAYQARAVLLAIGRRGTPRKLGVPGEELPKVVYRLLDPEQYRGRHVLVVGGGDSALEAAVSISDEPGTTVTLSYRSEAFSRAKEKNRQRIRKAAQAGRIRVLMKSNVKAIYPERVEIDQEGTLHDVRNDAVIIAAGGVLPTPFLKKIGIEVETKHGTA